MNDKTVKKTKIFSFWILAFIIAFNAPIFEYITEEIFDTYLDFTMLQRIFVLSLPLSIYWTIIYLHGYETFLSSIESIRKKLMFFIKKSLFPIIIIAITIITVLYFL